MRFDPFRNDRPTPQPGTRQRPAFMPLDAYRRGDQFVVHFDLPGIEPGSVEVTVERNVLNVSAERAWRPGSEVEVLLSERPQGHYSRQLYLGDALDGERVSAHYDQGVLTVTIPVAEAAKPRKVTVTSGAPGSSTTAPTGSAASTVHAGPTVHAGSTVDAASRPQ